VQIDDYCRVVTHAEPCAKRITKRRSRVALPYWVKAR
jgi:hypothetical protein